MNESLIKFKEVVDEEIQAYEALSELYKIKQTILVQGKSDALWDIDAQIIDKTDAIKSINSKRKITAGYLGNEDLTMSEAIEKAKAANDGLAESLQQQKNKITILSKTLTLQEKTNLTLIKHGLTMVGKTLDIIVGALMPQTTGQYNKSGQSVETDKSLISSIVEEV